MRMKEFGGYPIDLQFYRYIMYSWHHNVFINILGDPVVIANIYCKSRNLPNTEMQNYSTDLR